MWLLIVSWTMHVADRPEVHSPACPGKGGPPHPRRREGLRQDSVVDAERLGSRTRRSDRGNRAAAADRRIRTDGSTSLVCVNKGITPVIASTRHEPASSVTRHDQWPAGLGRPPERHPGKWQVPGIRRQSATGPRRGGSPRKRCANRAHVSHGQHGQYHCGSRRTLYWCHTVRLCFDLESRDETPCARRLGAGVPRYSGRSSRDPRGPRAADPQVDSCWRTMHCEPSRLTIRPYSSNE
jgi:hypothetical protein